MMMKAMIIGCLLALFIGQNALFYQVSTLTKQVSIALNKQQIFNQHVLQKITK